MGTGVKTQRPQGGGDGERPDQACGPRWSEWLGTTGSQTSTGRPAGPRLGAWWGETGPATPGMGHLETLTTSSSEPIDGVHQP